MSLGKGSAPKGIGSAWGAAETLSSGNAGDCRWSSFTMRPHDPLLWIENDGLSGPWQETTSCWFDMPPSLSDESKAQSSSTEEEKPESGDADKMALAMRSMMVIVGGVSIVAGVVRNGIAFPPSHAGGC